MPTFFAFKGIVHQISCVYTPQQNGVVERNINIFWKLVELLSFNLVFPFPTRDMVFCMLHFWSASHLHLCYIIKLLMNFCINNAFLSFCKSFWLSCLACTIDHGKSKFDPRGKQCIYLGNYSVTKGSVLLDISSQNLFISRDVLFLEHIFPYKHFAFVSPTYIFSKFVYL